MHSSGLGFRRFQVVGLSQQGHSRGCPHQPPQKTGRKLEVDEEGSASNSFSLEANALTFSWLLINSAILIAAESSRNLF